MGRRGGGWAMEPAFPAYWMQLTGVITHDGVCGFGEKTSLSLSIDGSIQGCVSQGQCR